MKSRCVQKKKHKKSRCEVKKSGEKTNKKKSRVVFGSRKKKKENNKISSPLVPVKSRKKNKKKKLVDGTIGEKRKRVEEEGEKKGEEGKKEEESFVYLQPSDYDEKKNNIVKFPKDLIAKSTFLSNAIEGVKGDIGVIPVSVNHNTLIKINTILTLNLRSYGRKKTLDDYVDLLMATQYLDMENLYDEIIDEIIDEKQIYEILNESKYRYKLNQDIINELFEKLSYDKQKSLMIEENDIVLSDYVLNSCELKYYYIIKKTVPLLDEINRKKLKVYVCLNPLESVDAYSSLDDKLKNFVTVEHVLNDININVIRNISLTVEDDPNIEYIDHDLLNNDQLNAISLESVVFYGFTRKLDNPPQYVNCRGKISFGGMTSLEYVESKWLHGTNAREIDFTGLSNLKKVGNYWLHYCVSLTKVIFTGLNNLKTVGDFWISSCRALVTVDFTGLNNLEEVGGLWLNECFALNKVNFSDLNNLKQVSFNWLTYCTALVTVDFKGLNNLKKVGADWLSNCKSLKTINFTGLNNLEKVDDYWLYGCEVLEEVNFTGLNNLKEVGYRWLSVCKDLRRVIFTGLNNLEKVYKYWLVGCRSLDKSLIDFTPLTSLRQIGDYINIHNIDDIRRIMVVG